MKQEKIGKIVKLNSVNNNFKIKGGTVDNFRYPYSVYINATSWVVFKKDIKNINSLIRQFRLEVIKSLKSSQYVSNYFDSNTIIQVDISPTRIRTAKPTFFELELNLYQKGYRYPLVKQKNGEGIELVDKIESIINYILLLEIFTNNNEYLDFQLTYNG